MSGKKVAIAAGHYDKPETPQIDDSGAVNEGFHLMEHFEAEKVVDKARIMLVNEGYIPVNFQGTVSEKIISLNREKDLLCIVEVHFNATERHTAKGCATLYKPNDKIGETLASFVQASLVTYLGEEDDGILEGWYRQDPDLGVLSLLAKTKFPAIIVEPLYIDNIEDVKKLTQNPATHSKIATGIVQGIKQFDQWLSKQA